ncbi:MAG: butyrate kinase [Firmicutes bacterium HGW-Firmicutes-7]|nr:MAG: butyrate kinase [Firmicutes bacterium HGW-Firmicutes-7]
MKHCILIINPGSTSTKIGVYVNEKPIFEETLRHSSVDLERYTNIYEQFQFRKDVILHTLKEKAFNLSEVDAIVGRGGLLKPIESGTYIVNEAMLLDLKTGVMGQHASNLGGILAYELAKPLKIPALIVDPVVVDEMEEIAKICGLPEIRRKSIFHALNQKAVAKKYAFEVGKEYNEINLIVAHLGGGISVGVHKNGKVIDVNNALDGEGPFSPERSGGLPMRDVIDMCFSGNYTLHSMNKKINGQGGYVAHFKTNNARQINIAAAEGDQHAKLIQDAMAYQVAKEIGKCATVLSGQVEAIVLTGGIAYNDSIVKEIKKRVEFIANVVIYPGEDEMLALAQGGLRVIQGEESVKVYQ